MSHLKTLIPYFKPYRKGLLLGLLMVLLANAFSLVGPYLIKLALDGLEFPATARETATRYALLLVAVSLFGGAARYGMRELFNGISRRIECDLRSDFFRHLLRLDASFYGRNRTGDLMSRATNDTLAVRMAVGPAIMYAANTTVTFIVALSLMLWISVRLTLLALIPMVFLPAVVMGFGRIIHRRFEAIQEQLSTLSTMVQENLTGVRIVRAYTQESAQAELFREINQEYMDRNVHLVRAAGLFHPFLMLFSGLAMVVVLLVGGLEVIAERISVGDFVAFGIYLALLIWPMIALGWVVNLFQRGAASMGRLNLILDTEPAVVAPAHAERAARFKGNIEYQNVSFRYPDSDRTVLRNLSFTVRAGETIAVVGPTGSGKSTLVSLLPRIYDPTEGHILVDGVPTPELHPGVLRAAIGMVPQDPFLFSESIRANIGVGVGTPTLLDDPGALAGPDQALGVVDGGTDPEVIEAARTAQLHESIEGFPSSYETQLGERGINLSGGQKQRATLARAVARDPVILILDDALSAVDTHTEAQILEDLRDVMRGRTSFIISHRVSAVMGADHILVLDEGALVEEGTHAELIALGGTYATLLRRQMLEQEIESAESLGSGT